MSLGQDCRVEEICDRAYYEEVELEEVINYLQRLHNSSETIIEIVKTYNRGVKLSEEQIDIACSRYAQDHIGRKLMILI